MKRTAAFGVATVLWIAIAACVGDDPGSANPPGSEDANGGLDGSVSDAPPINDTDACTTSCKTADIAVDCTGVERACALGCSPELKSCRTFDPAGPLAGSDLAENPAEADIDLPATPEPTIVSTATGAMAHPTTPVRAANGDAGKRETANGVTFERRDGVGIFHAKSWTLRNVIVEGDLPVAFVASGDVKIHGHVATTCGQVGGSPGNIARPGNGGGGQGSGAGGASGGGGGGHGSAGGKGADATGDDDEFLAGGPAGPVFAYDVANPRGGGSGGSGGNGGGLGGGVVIVVSGTSVRVGDGVTVTYKPPASGAGPVLKGINVGGCGGSGGRGVDGLQKSGSGGGAGGLVVIEAPNVLIDANSGLAANGGGGGGTSTSGRNAKLDDVPALGGEYWTGYSCANGAGGGRGAAGASAAEVGVRNTPACGEYELAGGGGGGGGRIVIRNKAGNVDNRAPTSILSPASALDVQALTTN